MSFFTKLRDSLYNFVNREGDFSLQFIADLIRGSHTKQEPKKHQSTQSTLNREQRQVYDDMLKRKDNEGQIEYWKRKKSLLNHKDIQSVINQEINSRKQKAHSSHKDQTIAKEIEKRKQQMRARQATKTQQKTRSR